MKKRQTPLSIRLPNDLNREIIKKRASELSLTVNSYLIKLIMEMTDLEKFIATYKQFGIEIKTCVNSKGNIEITLNGWNKEDTASDKFDGYSGFLSDLEFTKEGKFLRQGFWEQ